MDIEGKSKKPTAQSPSCVPDRPEGERVEGNAGENASPNPSAGALHCSKGEDSTPRTSDRLYIPTPLLPSSASSKLDLDLAHRHRPISSFFLSCNEVLQIGESVVEGNPVKRMFAGAVASRTCPGPPPSASAFQPVKSCSADIALFRQQIKSQASSPCTSAQSSPSDLRILARESSKGEDTAGRQEGKACGVKNKGKAGSRKRSKAEEKGEEEGCFCCTICEKGFDTAQALGGHMSRVHSGKSKKYNHKQAVRQKREFERVKLHLAKRKFFTSMHIDHDKMAKTPRGKKRIRELINRSKIKKIKRTIADDEVRRFILQSSHL